MALSGGATYRLERDRNCLLGYIKEIVGLADTEKYALGFWPETSLTESIIRGRLWALVSGSGQSEQLVGYIHFSGVYPHAKVQQIAVKCEFRRRGAAGALINALVSHLERKSYLTLKAEIADDLTGSLSFYRSNGFVEVMKRPGGKSRNRSIAVHVRELDTESLFSFSNSDYEVRFDPGKRRRAFGDKPIYAFDLNVYFDLVRDRSKSQQARSLFGAALAHTLRLVVADEFVNELKNTSNDKLNDPILQMAMQLPRLPKPSLKELKNLKTQIHRIVFEDTNHPAAGSSQSVSDAGHLAHAAIAEASAFVTRDSALLDARLELLSKIGIDVIALEELVAVLPHDIDVSTAPKKSGSGFQFDDANDSEVKRYSDEAGISKTIADKFARSMDFGEQRYVKVIRNENTILAIGIMIIPNSIQSATRALIHVSPEQPNASMFVDFLLDHLTRQACSGSPGSIELVHIPGQSKLHTLAQSRGFVRSKTRDRYEKIALGKPLTNDNWTTLARELRVKTGLNLPESIPDFANAGDNIAITNNKGQKTELNAIQLEDFLSPTIVIWPNRKGVVVPIAHVYANELLGTSRQHNFDFLENRDAAFLTRRGYVSSPRNFSAMRSETPIFFYESSGTGGLGAIVAVARIVDSVVATKSNLPIDRKKRLVVDSVEDFSASDDVLVTTFENLLIFPRPVSFKYLKQIDATGGTNLVSATTISGGKVTKILQKGWMND